MTTSMWVALLIGLVVGIVAGFRVGTWYLPAMLGKIEAWALRGRIKQYRRRR